MNFDPPPWLSVEESRFPEAPGFRETYQAASGIARTLSMLRAASDRLEGVRSDLQRYPNHAEVAGLHRIALVAAKRAEEEIAKFHRATQEILHAMEEGSRKEPHPDPPRAPERRRMAL